MRQMPSQRTTLKNALTSESSSNTAAKERQEQTSHLSQAQMVQSPAHGGLMLDYNTSPDLSEKAREMHLPTTEPGNQQQQESGEPQT